MSCLCVFTLTLVTALCDYVSVTQQLGRNVLESEKVWQEIGGRGERTSAESLFFPNVITNNRIINVPHDDHLNRRIIQNVKNLKLGSLENNLDKNNRASLQSLGLYKFHRQPGLIKLFKDYFNHIRPTVSKPSSSYHNLKYLKPSDSFDLGDSLKWSNPDSIKRVKGDVDSPRENWKFILDALISQTKPVRFRDRTRTQPLLYKEPHLSTTGHLTNSIKSDLLNVHNTSKISNYHQTPFVNRINFNKNLSNSLSFKNTDNLINHAEYPDSNKLNSGIGGKTILQLSSLLENSLKDKIALPNTVKSSHPPSDSPLNSINLALIANALSRNSDRDINLKLKIPKGNRENKHGSKSPNTGIAKMLNNPDVEESMKSSPSFEKENKTSKISIITSKGASIDSVSSPLQTYKSKSDYLDALSARMSEISNLSFFLRPVNKSQINSLAQIKELTDQGNNFEKNRLKLMTENLRRLLGEQNILLTPFKNSIKDNNFINRFSSQGYTRLPSDASSELTKHLPNNSSDSTGCKNVEFDGQPNGKLVPDSFAMFKSKKLKSSSTGLGESTSQPSLFRNGSVHSCKFLNNLIPLLKSSSNLAIGKYSLDSDNIGIRNRVMNMGKSTVRLKIDSDTTRPSILEDIDIESIKHIPLSNTENRLKTYDIELISTTEGKFYIAKSERSRQNATYQISSLNKSKFNSSRASDFALKVDFTTRVFESYASTRQIKHSKPLFSFETSKEPVESDKSDKSDLSPVGYGSIVESEVVTTESVHNNCNFTESYSLESYALVTELDSNKILSNEGFKTFPKTETTNSNHLLHINPNVNLNILESNFLKLISNYTESNEVTTSNEDITSGLDSTSEYFTTSAMQEFTDTTGGFDNITVLNKAKKQNTSESALSKINNNQMEAYDSLHCIAKPANMENFETNPKINQKNLYQEISTVRNVSVSSNRSGLESISDKNHIDIGMPSSEISNLDLMNNGIKYLSTDKTTLNSNDYLNLIDLLITHLQDNDKDENHDNSGSSFLASYGGDLPPNILAKETFTDKVSRNNTAPNCSETMSLIFNQTVDPGYKLLEAMRAYVIENAPRVNSSSTELAFEKILSDPQMFLKSAILNTINQIDNFPSKVQCLPFKNKPKETVENMKDDFMHTDAGPIKNISLVGSKKLEMVPKNVLDLINDANVKGIAVVLISLKPTEASTLLKKTDLKKLETERGLPGTAFLGANATVVIDVSNRDDNANKTGTTSSFREDNVSVGMKINEVTLYPVFPLYPVYPVKPILSNLTHEKHEVRS